MQIDSIKTKLRHLVLLVKEYKDIRVTEEEEKEANRIQAKIDNKESINIYESQFLMAIWKIKRDILKELDYHSKKLLDEFELYESKDEPMEIDERKVEFARKQLTKEEFDLLGSFYKLIVREQHLEKENKDGFPKVKIRDISSQLDEFLDTALTVQA